MSLSEAYGLRAAVCFGFEVTFLFIEVVAVVLDCKFMLTVAILSLLGRPMLFGKSYPRELSDGARLTSDGSPRGHQQTSYEQQ